VLVRRQLVEVHADALELAAGDAVLDGDGHHLASHAPEADPETTGAPRAWPSGTFRLGLALRLISTRLGLVSELEIDAHLA
jgi:hypothetical protein